jgi:manganese/zinc/iron transport system ATP- binding protein
MEQSALQIHNLNVAYSSKPVLYGLDLTVPKGCLVGIMGPNGAGKSTLIKTILGIIKPNSGQIKIFGKSLKANKYRIGYVPQKETVDWDFPVTVFDVVMMGRYPHIGLIRRPGVEDKKKVFECLEKLGMQAYADQQIAKLSGGQQQRVFLARALAQESDLYFMDEPFAGVDATTETIIIDLLSQLQKQGKTILVVHHDLTTAKHYFHSLILLNLRLVAFGPANKVLTPQNLQATYGGKLGILTEVAKKEAEENRVKAYDR